MGTKITGKTRGKSPADAQSAWDASERYWLAQLLAARTPERFAACRQALCDLALFASLGAGPLAGDEL